MARRRTSYKPDLLEIGGRAIYEFRAHPRRPPWAAAMPDRQGECRERMRQVLDVLAGAGYAVAPRKGNVV